VKLCAVIDCPNPGRPQICPYDHKYHHHGCIHYDCGRPVSQLTFRGDGWYWICDEHYEMVSAERKAFEEGKPSWVRPYHG